jgi:hypothetical protein
MRFQGYPVIHSTPLRWEIQGLVLTKGVRFGGINFCKNFVKFNPTFLLGEER